MGARFIQGDALERLRELPDASVDLVFSSPPFLGLRSYLPEGHADKAREIGSEPTPATFIDVLLDITEQCARVLTPHGSLCFELGDTYSGSGGAGGDYAEGGWRDGQPKYPRRVLSEYGDAWPLAKSLCLVPELYRTALVYGRNPLNGRTTPRWRVRNVVRWHRPNPPIGALGDKFRPATSDVVMACKSAKRYFDIDAVREPYNRDYRWGEPTGRNGDSWPDDVASRWSNRPTTLRLDRGGAPPLDTWVIPTAPYKGAHYAAFPEPLVLRPVLAMSPQRVCQTCGEPSRRIVEATHDVDEQRRRREEGVSHGKAVHDRGDNGASTSFLTTQNTTIGWTDCGHDAWRRGVVLDPFAGTGTVLAVAVGNGRDAIGIDLDERNIALAEQRCGMFLTVEASVPA